MPISVNTIVAHANLAIVEGVNWGTPIKCKKEGVYIISLKNIIMNIFAYEENASISQSKLLEVLEL